MISITVWAIIFSICTSASIALLGSRNLIGGNLFNVNTLLHLVTSWQFISAMFLALMSRLSFMILNNQVLKIPSLSNSATTIAALITVVSFIFIIICNYLFLHERLSSQQLVGAGIIFIGLIVLLK